MYKAILFDLDGTLLNTNALVIESFQHTLQTHLGLNLSPEELTVYFGEPLRTTLARFSPTRVDEMIVTYRLHNLSRHDELTTPFSSVAETLETLYQHGIKLAVVTSKMKETALRGLNLYGLASFFSCIVGLEDTIEHKPHPQPVLNALQELGVKPEETLMVGDSPADIGCGQAAGTDCALVSYTLIPRQQFQGLKPFLVLSDLGELLTILRISGKEAVS